MSLLVGLLLLLAFAGLGLAALFAMPGPVTPRWLWSLAFPLGAGLLTWVLFLLSWAGIPLNRLTVILTYLILLGLLLGGAGRAGRLRMPAMTRDGGLGESRFGRAIRVASWIAFGLLLLSAAVVSVGHSHGRWDAAAGWVVKGYGIFLEGTIHAGATWGAWGLAYPLNLHMQNGLFYLFGAEVLPASKLLFPCYLASLAAGAYAFWRDFGVRSSVGAMALVLIASNPLFYLHATIGYANLPLAAYVIPAGLLAVTAATQSRPHLWLPSGIMLALAAWTRPEGIAYCLAVLAALGLAGLLFGFRWIERRTALLLFPVAIVAGSWFLFGWTSVEASHLGKAMGGVLPSLLSGEYRLRELYLIPRLLFDRLIDPKTWGILLPASIVLLALGWRKITAPRRYRPEAYVFLLTALVIIVPIGLFYVRSFTRYTDFIPLLNRSFDRAFIPAAILIIVEGVLLAFRPLADPDTGEISRAARPPISSA